MLHWIYFVKNTYIHVFFDVADMLKINCQKCTNDYEVLEYKPVHLLCIRTPAATNLKW